jgi:uncharacterized protein DUF6788
MSRQRLIARLLKTTQSMLQGGLSETSRRCGNPNCICHRDPTRLHGPNLYITYRVDGKGRSLYVPPDQCPIRAQGATGLVFLLGDGLCDRRFESRKTAEAIPAREAGA